MVNLKFIIEYLFTVYGKWTGFMTALIGVIVWFLQTFYPTEYTVYAKWIFIFSAVLYYVFASYYAWALEHEKVLETEAEKTLKQVEIIYENGEPYLTKIENPKAVTYVIQVAIMNVGSKTNSFQVFCEEDSKPRPLPLLVADDVEQTSFLLHPKERKFIRLARWSSDSFRDISLLVPSKYNKEKILDARAVNEITIRVTGNDMLPYSKKFRLYITHEYLTFEPINN
jgi:hypothetical protein